MGVSSSNLSWLENAFEQARLWETGYSDAGGESGERERVPNRESGEAEGGGQSDECQEGDSQ